MSNRYNHTRRNPDDVLTKVKAMIAQKDYEDSWSYITDFLNSRRRSWKQAHDEIMMIFVTLCVDLRKNPQDGFFKYRLICTTAHLSSLEKCLRELISQANEKGDEEYKALLEEFTERDMEDADVKKEFTQKQFALPHLKYEWIVYRAVLDILRNNQKLDPLYQETVRYAIKFCIDYERSSEYRKLCKACRRHLDFIFNRQDQTNHVEIHEPKMLGVYLHTRFELLESATKLNMWQEAYKLITDIHGLKEKSKTVLEPSLLTAYYKKLSQIFLSSNKNLLHACAILKYYNLARDAAESGEESTKKYKKDKSGLPSEQLKEEEINLLGMSCVLAVLSCPLPRCRSQVMGPTIIPEQKKDRIMAEKLDFYPRPNRNELLRQLEYEDLLDLTEELKMLRKVIVSDFSPLSLCKTVGGLMKAIVEKQPKLERYAKTMEEATARKLIISISKMYSTITFERLHKMFFSDWTQRQIEELIIEMVQKNFIWCRLSHQDKMCFFRPAERINRDSFMKNYLARMVSTVNSLCEKELPYLGQGESRAQFYDSVRNALKFDKDEVNHRVSIITKAIKETELVNKMKKEVQNYEKNKSAWKLNKKKLEEEKRMAEQRQKEEERMRVKLKENEEMKKAREKASAQLKKVNLLLEKNTKMKKSKKQKAAEDILMQPGEDVVAIKEVVINVIQETKDKIQKRMQEELRQHDYAVREWRKAEIPLLHEKYKHEAKDSHEDKIAEWTKQVAQLKEEHDRKLKVKKLYNSTQDHAKLFYKKFETRREDNFKQAMDIWTEQKEKHEEKQRKRKEEKDRKKEELRAINQAEIDESNKREAVAQARRQPVASPRQSAPMTRPATAAPRRQEPQRAAPPMRPQAPPQPPKPNRYMPPSRRNPGEAGLPRRAPAQRTQTNREKPENTPPTTPAEPEDERLGFRTQNASRNVRPNNVRPGGRPRFVNSKKKEAKAEDEEEEGKPSDSTESTQSPRNVRPGRRKLVRPARKLVRPSRREPPQGVPEDTSSKKYVPPPRQQGSVRPARVTGSRATGSPRQGIVRNTNVRARNTMRSNEPSLPSQVSSPRDLARNSIDGALNAASGRPRPERSIGGSWRDRETMKDKGYLANEKPAVSRNVRPSRSRGGPRRFINSKTRAE